MKTEKNREKFFRDGIIEVDFKSKKLDEVLKKIKEKELKKGYSLEEKYKNTLDLRPSVIEYDPVFLDVLKENNIKEIIKKTTLVDYSLFHIQARVVHNEKSYMDWHRDTYYVKGKPIGKTPNGVKLIYYPDLDEDQSPRLDFMPGSQNILFPTNEYDRQLFDIMPTVRVSAKKEKAILFNTRALHSVVPEKTGKNSIRLVYVFFHKDQIIDDHSNDELHMRTMKKYEEI